MPRPGVRLPSSRADVPLPILARTSPGAPGYVPSTRSGTRKTNCQGDWRARRPHARRRERVNQYPDPSHQPNRRRHQRCSGPQIPPLPHPHRRPGRVVGIVQTVLELVAHSRGCHWRLVRQCLCSRCHWRLARQCCCSRCRWQLICQCSRYTGTNSTLPERADRDYHAPSSRIVRRI